MEVFPSVSLVQRLSLFVLLSEDKQSEEEAQCVLNIALVINAIYLNKMIW